MNNDMEYNFLRDLERLEKYGNYDDDTYLLMLYWTARGRLSVYKDVMGYDKAKELEDKPKYQYELVDTGLVTAIGCVNGSYKGHTTYDCSVDIEWEYNGLERMVIKFGVLPNDSIGKWCGSRLWQDYKCRYGRL